MQTTNTFHSDGKPANLVLDSPNSIFDSFKILIFWIDFGVSTRNFNEIPSGYSEAYAP